MAGAKLGIHKKVLLEPHIVKNLARGVRVREGTMGALPRELGPRRNREPPRDFTIVRQSFQCVLAFPWGRKQRQELGRWFCRQYSACM